MKIKNFKLNPRDLINSKIYYLIGVLKDGCLTTQWTIKIKQKNKEWLSDVIVPTFKQVFDKEIKNNIYLQKEYKPVWYLAFKDKLIWQKLNEFQNRQPKTINEQKFYIMGFWDTDGGCPKNPTPEKKMYIKFTQKEKKSLEELKQMIENFGIKCGKVRISEHNDCGEIWRFSITNKEGIINFCDLIGSLHPEKKRRLTIMRNLLSSR
ncbi:MAG: LAGLIDADG family homing endonuclease [archaeon]|nr:MAG: LAGLIDADG family homing endonuclease [archaeon]